MCWEGYLIFMWELLENVEDIVVLVSFELKYGDVWIYDGLIVWWRGYVKVWGE